MKRKIIIILSVLIISLTIVKLYQTFATNSLVTVSDNVYNITLTDNSSITVPAKSSKTIIYQICNTNKGIVQYEVGYTSTSSDIEVKEWWDTIDSSSGTIDYGENKFIKLKLSNYSAEDSVFTLSTILGYEHGGDLIVPSGTTSVTEKINEHNYLKGITSSLDKTEISSITFVNDNIAPDGVKEYVSQNDDGSVMLWYGEANDNGLYDVYIGSDNGITSLSTGNSLFSGYSNLVSIDFDNVDTSNVTTMYAMFYGCSNLTNLNIDIWNISNVTSMASMFNGCNKLTNLDVSNWNTSNVTNMASMFGGCSSLTNLDLSNWNTSNVTDMRGMFNGCSKLATLNLSSFDTSNVTYMGNSNIGSAYRQGMFQGCSSLKVLDLSSFDTSNVTVMNAMFYGCSSLENIIFGDEFDTSNVTSMVDLFGECSSLTSLDLSGFNTQNLNNINTMFYNCSNLITINLNNADFTNVTSYTDMLSGVDNTNLVINGNAGLKEWFTTNYSDYANNVVVPSA